MLTIAFLLFVSPVYLYVILLHAELMPTPIYTFQTPTTNALQIDQATPTQ